MIRPPTRRDRLVIRRICWWLDVAQALVIGVVLGISLAGCPKPGPSPVGPDADAAIGTPTCAAACAHVAALGCGTGAACDSVCRRVLRDSFRACVAVAQDCDGVDACGRTP